jgi:hypothetical protein
MEQAEKFDSWGIVEVMGHKRFAGHVTEQTIAGSALVRVDVPETRHQQGDAIETKPGYTKLIGVGSIYCLTPTTEEVARLAAQQIERYNDPLPVALPVALPVPRAALAAGARDDEEADWERLEYIDDL